MSPYTAGTGPIAYNTSHYDLVSTIEWLLGLAGTGTGNDTTVEFPVMAQLFHPSLFGSNVSLQYTDLRGVDLAGDNLRGDNLEYADLQGTNLEDAQLQGADLQGATLEGTSLEYTDFAGADLQGATLVGASLEYANLSNSDLSNAICGKSNYIIAKGANPNAEGVPAACIPPL